MQRPFKRLEPILTSLPVFEAAARLGSFTAAAHALGLTQPTVSHHIQNIETMLGTELFERRHNRIALTSQGKALSEAVAMGLGHIDRTAREVGLRGGRDSLTVACSFGFAHGWLRPRFGRLRQALSGFPVHLVTTDWLQGYDRDEADIVVVWAGVGSSRHEHFTLFPEDVAPVCSPDFLHRHPELGEMPDPARLPDYPLVHFDERDSQFLNWAKWFETQGVAYVSPAGAYRYANFEFMVQALSDGEGIGLGWIQLIEEPLARGELIRVGPTVRNHEAAYSVEYHRGGVKDAVLEQALDWFRGEAESA